MGTEKKKVHFLNRAVEWTAGRRGGAGPEQGSPRKRLGGGWVEDKEVWKPTVELGGPTGALSRGGAVRTWEGGSTRKATEEMDHGLRGTWGFVSKGKECPGISVFCRKEKLFFLRRGVLGENRFSSL